MYSVVTAIEQKMLIQYRIRNSLDNIEKCHSGKRELFNSLQSSAFTFGDIMFHLTLFAQCGCISSLLPRLPKLPGPFEYYWLGNLGSNKTMQPVNTQRNRKHVNVTKFQYFPTNMTDCST